MSAIIGLSLFSCKKAQVTPTRSKEYLKQSEKPENNSDKTIHCFPWRDTADYAYRYNKIATDGAGSILYYPAYTTVTIADQYAIWNDALNQANSIIPTGYIISSVNNFRTEVASGPFLVYFIKFDITYIKCADGGGGEN
nr:hypothetical protein [uncultured Fluviicola sp.]